MALEPPPTQATSRVRQPAFRLQHLRARLLADHPLEVAHHRRIGVRAGRRADQVVGVLDVGHPVAQRLVHGVLQGGRAAGHRPHLGAQQLHARDVGRLPLHVHRAHVDHAGQAVAGADRGGGDAVLAGAGLGDDPRSCPSAGQQDLAHAVVDLVRAGVVQLLALQPDARAVVLGQPLGEIERARAADIVLQFSRPARPGTPGRPWPRARRSPAPAPAASASRRHSGRRSRRIARRRRDRPNSRWSVRGLVTGLCDQARRRRPAGRPR